MSRFSPKMLVMAVVAATAGAMTILPAAAAEGKPNQDRPVPFRAQIMFNLVDANGDGVLDQTEIAALQKAIFTALDTDKDGKLSQDEFRKVTAGGERGPRGQRFSRDGHGPQGGPGFHRGHGGRGGPDRQGQLDEQMMPGNGPQGGPQLGQNEEGPTAGPRAPRNFASLDTNGDGTVSADEFANGAPGIPLLPQ